MRSHGVNVPDPTFNGNGGAGLGGGFGFRGGFRSIERNSPAFQAAPRPVRACGRGSGAAGRAGPALRWSGDAGSGTTGA